MSFYGIRLVGLFSVFALWVFVSLSSSLIYSFLCDCFFDLLTDYLIDFPMAAKQAKVDYVPFKAAHILDYEKIGP